MMLIRANYLCIAHGMVQMVVLTNWFDIYV